MGKHTNGNKNKYVGGDSNAVTLKSNTTDSSLTSENTTVPYIIPKTTYNVKLFGLFSIVGVMIHVLFGTKSTYATTTIWGSSSSVLSLIGLLVSVFAISSRDSLNQGVVGFFKLMVARALPIFLLIGILGFVIFQNISFYKQINSGNVSDEYYTFAGTSSFFIVIQMILVLKYIKDVFIGVPKKDSDGKNDATSVFTSELNSIIMVLTIINISFIGMLQVILKYFSTDG